MEQFRKATEKDETLQLLKSCIQNVWPSQHNDIPTIIRPYYNYRQELSINLKWINT